MFKKSQTVINGLDTFPGFHPLKMEEGGEVVGWAEVLEVVKGLKAKLAFLFSKTSSLGSGGD